MAAASLSCPADILRVASWPFPFCNDSELYIEVHLPQRMSRTSRTKKGAATSQLPFSCLQIRAFAHCFLYSMTARQLIHALASNAFIRNTIPTITRIGNAKVTSPPIKSPIKMIGNNTRNTKIFKMPQAALNANLMIPPKIAKNIIKKIIVNICLSSFYNSLLKQPHHQVIPTFLPVHPRYHPLYLLNVM